MTIQEIISKDRTAIMGMAMIVIMLSHQPFFSKNILTDFFHLFGYWGVEVFLFVSGFGIVYSLKKNSTKVYYKNRLIRLLPSCLIVGVCKYIFVQMGFVEFIPAHIFGLFANLYLWYIYAIIAYYIIAPLLYKVLIKSALILFIGTFLLSFACHYVPFDKGGSFLVIYIGWITERLPVFVLGMIYAKGLINISVSKTMLLGIAFYVICVVLRWSPTEGKFLYKIPLLSLLIQFAAPMLCVFASYIQQLASKLRLSKITLFCGTISLELYLWHEYVFHNMYRDERFSFINIYFKCALAVGLSVLFAYLTHILAKFFQNRCLSRS